MRTKVTRRILAFALARHVAAVGKEIKQSDARISAAYEASAKVITESGHDVDAQANLIRRLEEDIAAARENLVAIREDVHNRRKAAVAEAERINKAEGAIQDSLYSELAKAGAFAQGENDADF